MDLRQRWQSLRGESIVDQELGSSLINENHYVQRVEENLRGIGSPSLGSEHLAEMIHWHFQNPGKLLRSRIIFRLGKVLDLNLEKTLLWGTVCELIHNASLVHDDLQDGDTLRRGRDSIWRRFGKAQSINFGDFLMVQPGRVICQSSLLTAEEKNQLNLLVSMSIAQLACGQIHDIASRHQKAEDCNFNSFLHMTRQKTGTLFRLLGQGLASFEDYEPNSNFSQNVFEVLEGLGVFFQLVDDTLDLFGEKGRGQQGCDLYEGKFSFLVAMHQRFAPDDTHRLWKILKKSRSETDIFDVEWFRGRLLSEPTLRKCFQYLGMKLTEIDRKILTLNHEPLIVILRRLVSDILLPLKTCREMSILREHCDAKFEY